MNFRSRSTWPLPGVLWLATTALFAADPISYVFKRVGSLQIEADVYRPAHTGKRPCVFWIHGGALIMGHRGNLRALQRQQYLDAGYVVVSPDYRLAPETKLPEILADLRDAYQWVREKGPDLFGIDPSRIAVVGHSAGGYLALSTAGFSPPPRAIVSFCGYGDIGADWYAKPDAFYLRQLPVSREEAFAAVGSQGLTGTRGPNQRFRFYLFARQQGLWPELVAGISPSDRAIRRYCLRGSRFSETPANAAAARRRGY